MSGGSMDYVYATLETRAQFTTDTPQRKAFKDHLDKVVRALHDIEWVDSGDYGPGRENAAIAACLSPLPYGWDIKRADQKPFKRILVVAPNGYAAAVDSIARNPANVLYLLADALLSASGSPPSAPAGTPASGAQGLPSPGIGT